MATWLNHIDRFQHQYDKAFVKDPPFGADLVERIHKRVQVFSHSFNMTSIEDVDTGALAEFRKLQKKIDRGKWIQTKTIWVDRSTPKK